MTVVIHGAFPVEPKAAPRRVVVAYEPVDREMIWRETCCEFLDACFNGAPAERIQVLGHEVYYTREAMVRAR